MPAISSRALIINALLFQIAWFAALYGAVLDWVIVGTLPAVFAAIWHLYRLRLNFRTEIQLIIAVLMLGFGIESLFIALGTLIYVGNPVLQYGPPVWILAMWLAFATLPNGCLAWLKGKWVLQIILGGLTGPLSYLAGGKLGGATLQEPVLTSLAIIGAGWAIALPMIFWLAGRLRADQNGS